MTQRATAGEATIFKDELGRWHGWITVGLKTNGQRDRRHRSGKTRKEVVEKIRDLEVKRETGQISAVTSDTVTGWLEHWLTNIAARRVRPRTLESYESMVRMHISPGIGRHRLDRLQPEHLEHFYSDLLDDGLSAATVLRAHRIISRALKVAMQRGRVHRNVAMLVDPPAQRRSEAATALDLDESRAVLAAAAGLRNSARWTVALALGLRQSEALALQWRDIDLLNNSLSVRRTIHRVKGGGLVYEAPKTKRSERTLALPLPLVAALHVHKAAQMGERMLAGSDWQNDDDLVFAQANGRPIDKKSDYDDWCQLLERAGVRHVRLHDGRHTAATLLLSEGVHPRVVMELLGHSQMRTTMDIYSHVMPALAREAADRMGAVLLSPLATIGNQTGNQPKIVDLAEGSSPLEMGGAEGTRTPDPHTASVVRYQLRHSPQPGPLDCHTVTVERAESEVYTRPPAPPNRPGSAAGHRRRDRHRRPPAGTAHPDTPRRHPPDSLTRSQLSHTGCEPYRPPAAREHPDERGEDNS
jgi:integrase